MSSAQRRFFGYAPTSTTPPSDPEPEPLLHKFSSTQVQVVGRPAELARKLAAGIPKSDLGPDGVEHETHITVKYGVHFQTPTKRMRAALARFGPVAATLGNQSVPK